MFFNLDSISIFQVLLIEQEHANLLLRVRNKEIVPAVNACNTLSKMFAKGATLISKIFLCQIFDGAIFLFINR